MISDLKYTYIDGDNIGLKIESSFLENNEEALILINNTVKIVIEAITQYLIKHNQQIIFSGADGIICKGEDLNLLLLLTLIRTMDYGITFSIGNGNSLRDAYIALRYAKSINKNKAVKLDNFIFNTIK